MIPVNRRKALFLAADALAGLVVAKVGSNRPRMMLAGSTAAASVTADAAITLTDDFAIPPGATEVIGRRIQDSAGSFYTWTQLLPSPAWRSRQGAPYSTGDPGIVNGKLIRRDPITAMYPGLSLPGVPAQVEVDFFFDPDPQAVGLCSVFIHLFADTDGTKATSEIPMHLVLSEKGYAVKAVSTIAGDADLTGFGTFQDVGSKLYEGGVRLARGVKHTVTLDFIAAENKLTITFPAAATTLPVTLTDPRLTGAMHPGGGPGRFLVLEDEADLANEPYNGFYAVRIVLGSSGGGGGAPAITSVVPAARGQGAKNLPVDVAGTGFAAGAGVAISGTGVTVVSNTFVSASKIALKVTVAARAATGERTLTVTNPDGGTASAPFTVTPKPLPTASATPSVPRGRTQTVTIPGKNFAQGDGLKVQVVGAGISTGAPTWVSSTSITVPVTVQSTATAGAYKVTVTNPDGGKGSRANCLTVT